MARTIWFSNWNFRFSHVNGKYPKCLTSFKFYQTRSNKASKRKKVWSTNNVWSCLIAKHFPFWPSFLYMCTYPSQRRFSSLLWESKNAFHDCLSTNPIERIIWMKKKKNLYVLQWNVRVLTVPHTHIHCCSIIWSSYAVERKMKLKINEKI